MRYFLDKITTVFWKWGKYFDPEGGVPDRAARYVGMAMILFFNENNIIAYLTKIYYSGYSEMNNKSF